MIHGSNREICEIRAKKCIYVLKDGQSLDIFFKRADDVDDPLNGFQIVHHSL